MKISDPETGAYVETTCTGCPCHWDQRIVMHGVREDGCCAECGCPRNETGFESYARRFPMSLHEPCPICGNDAALNGSRWEIDRFPYGVDNPIWLEVKVIVYHCNSCNMEWTDWLAAEARDAATRPYRERRT